VKKIFPWKFNLEYGSTFTKLFMHVSSRNMFPRTRNLQIRVHVYPPHHCGDWLTFGCFVPMIADHDLVKKRSTIMNAEASTHTFLTMIIEESVRFMSCEPFFCVQLFLCSTHVIYIYIYFFFLSTEHCTWAIISPKELKSWVTRTSFALLYWKTELSAVKYFAICS
jgi:hypothetical protein